MMNDNEILISSKEVMAETSISRATLNNYIKMGILPRPIVKSPVGEKETTTKIGYFPKEVLNRIETLKKLKREGYSMEEIASKLTDASPDRFSPIKIENGTEFGTKRSITSIQDKLGLFESKSLKVTIDDIPHAALLVNQNFEIEWINDAAENQIFNCSVKSITELESRNIFKLFFKWEFHDAFTNWKEIMAFHLAFAKSRLTKSQLEKIYEGVTGNAHEIIKKLYDEQQPVEKEGITNRYLKIENQHGEISTFQVYSVFFREGIFFVYIPAEEPLAQFLEILSSSRENVIKDLLRQRMPSLVSLCALVADLQDSVKISAELPPAEYFELINGLWKRVNGCFEKYGGISGKHSGDGILHYFIKKPGENYIMDALRCALEIREITKEFSNEWRAKKGWLNDLYLNMGINEGKEYFGTIQSSSNIEFTALGDSINYTGRLSDLARFGAILATKNVINKVKAEELECIHYGIRRNVEGREIFIKNSFSRVIDLLENDNKLSNKYIDVANLPITEIIDITLENASYPEINLDLE